MEDLFKKFIYEFNRVFAYQLGLTATYDEDANNVQITGSFLSDVDIYNVDELLYSPIVNGLEIRKINGYLNLFELLDSMGLELTPVQKWNEIKYLKVDIKETADPINPTHYVQLDTYGRKLGMPVPMSMEVEEAFKQRYLYNGPLKSYVKFLPNGHTEKLFHWK